MFYFTVLCSISILCWTPAAVRVVSTGPQLILPRESETGALYVAHLIVLGTSAASANQQTPRRWWRSSGAAVAAVRYWPIMSASV